MQCNPHRPAVEQHHKPWSWHGIQRPDEPSRCALSRIAISGHEFTSSHVLPDAAKQFKLMVAQDDKITQEMLTEAISDLFAKFEFGRIA